MDVVLQLVVAADDTELASGRLWALGATAVEERPPVTGSADIVLLAGFPTAAAVEAAAAVLAGSEILEITDDSWRDAWRIYAEPVDAGQRMRVVPAWPTRPATSVPSGRFAVHIDPGQCFGSGGHPTTRMLLALLERFVGDNTTVLDVGTGSGILAVAAARLGAACVTAIDIDPASVDVATANAAANGVGGRIKVSTTPLASITDRFDIVVANLSAATLADLAEPMLAAAGDSGVLLLSGLLPGQWPHLEPAFGPATEVVELDGWVAVIRAR